MKTLYMVRHAKSSWKHDVSDHERPLKNRGHQDAKMVANKIKDEIDPPEIILSSDANRALTTAGYFKKALNIKDGDFKTDHQLYDFSGQQVMAIIKKLPENYDRVMIVGHNHAFTSIANMLGNNYIENVPTSGFVMLTFNVDKWDEISTGKTEKTIFPRDLK